jgi:hypothetical protein
VQSNNTLLVGKESYPLAPVFLHSRPQREPSRTFLSIDLNGQSDKTAAGLAINCLSLLEQSSIEQIQGLSLRFSHGEDNPHIELGESVITKPGRNLFDLEISELSLIFGRIQGNRIPIEMSGTCFNLVTAAVQMHAHFEAEIKS